MHCKRKWGLSTIHPETENQGQTRQGCYVAAVQPVPVADSVPASQPAPSNQLRSWHGTEIRRGLFDEQMEGGGLPCLGSGQGRLPSTESLQAQNSLSSIPGGPFSFLEVFHLSSVFEKEMHDLVCSLLMWVHVCECVQVRSCCQTIAQRTLAGVGIRWREREMDVSGTVLFPVC